MVNLSSSRVRQLASKFWIYDLLVKLPLGKLLEPYKPQFPPGVIVTEPTSHYLHAWLKGTPVKVSNDYSTSLMFRASIYMHYTNMKTSFCNSLLSLVHTVLLGGNWLNLVSWVVWCLCMIFWIHAQFPEALATDQMLSASFKQEHRISSGGDPARRTRLGFWPLTL